MKSARFIFLALLVASCVLSQDYYIENKQIGDGAKTVGLKDVPVVFRLFQNNPNPFNPTTKIKFALPIGINYTLRVYDLLGNEVYNESDYREPGVYEIEFDGSNLSSGIYFYSLETIAFSQIKKMILVK